MITDDITSSIAGETSSKFAVEATAKTLLPRAGSPSAPPRNPLLEHSTSTLSALSMEEINTAAAPLAKQSFQNRREQSELLKKSFPAGFRLHAVRAELVDDPHTHMLQRANRAGVRSLPAAPTGSVGPSGAVKGFSFVDWARGGSVTDFNDELRDDPFADCAGPSLAELQRARRALRDSPSAESVANDPACVVRKAPIATKTIMNGSQLSHSSSGIQSRVKVFHAPAALPTLTPVLGGSSSFVLNQQAGRSRTSSGQYERWLRDRRLRAGENAWRTKGNDATHNYSAYEFRGEDSSLARAHLLRGSSSSPSLGVIPQPWKPEISLEIYTMKQIMKAERPDEHSQQFVLKTLSSETLLQDLRLSIARDIVEGIKSAFPDLPVLLNAPDYNLVPMPVERIDMVFTFFHEELQCWRPLQSEADWVECKNLCTLFGKRIKIMYALEEHSEKQLVEQIQRNYELQRELLAKKKPPISVEDLTAALDAENKRKARTVPPVLQKQKSSVSPSEKNTLFAAERSVLYPKSSAALKQLQSNSQASLQRLENFASNLEGRILKTRW